MNDTFAALIIMTIWAIWIVALSRWKYWLWVIASFGAYAGALVMMRALGFGAVAIAWAAMSASSAAIDVMLDRTPRAERNVSPIASAFAAFVVGLIGWPLMFAGTHYPPKAATTAPSESFARDDDDGEPERAANLEPTLARRAGIANFAIGDFRFERESDGEPASLLDANGSLQGFYESTATHVVFEVSATQLDRASIYGLASEVVATFLDRRTAPLDRDGAYALAASFGRVYPGAIRVEDSLEGL